MILFYGEIYAFEKSKSDLYLNFPRIIVTQDVQDWKSAVGSRLYAFCLEPLFLIRGWYGAESENME